MDLLFKKTLDIEKISKKIDNLKKKADKIFTKIKRKLDVGNDSKKIKIVLVGESSVGKSSIIKMLTHRDDIQIGAGITTLNTETFDWNGIEIVDTPGINTELIKEHDTISYKAISEADILMFVITNELIDSQFAQSFRKIAIDTDKANEMILVVNKMDRANEGNTPEQGKIIIEGLKGQKIFEPYTPEDLNICFISTKQYFRSIKFSEEDPELAKDLYVGSGYENFIETINSFVSQRGIIGRITTPVYKLAEQVRLAIEDLEYNLEDSDNCIEGSKEAFRQKIQRYEVNRKDLKSELDYIFETAVDNIKELGHTTSVKIIDDCKNDEEAEYIMKIAQKQVKEFADEAYKLCEEKLNEYSNKLEIELKDIESSKFSYDLSLEISKNIEKYPSELQSIFANIKSTIGDVGKNILQNSYKPGITEGWKLPNFSGSPVHKFILDVAHFLDIKLPPWGAVKLARCIGIAGGVLQGVGCIWAIYSQLQEDKKEKEMFKQKTDDKQKIRSLFNDIADKLAVDSRKHIDGFISEYFDKPINEYETAISKLRKTRENRDENCKKLEEIYESCITLVKEIHKSNIKYLSAPSI